MTSARRSCVPKAVFANCPRLSILLSCMFLLVMAIVATPLHSQTYTDLHDFNCSIDGCRSGFAATPAQGRDGNLYGTLQTGGTGIGTVYKITPSGTFAVLHDFTGPDGYVLNSGLTLGPDGNFYGATTRGDTNDAGTLFKITPEGVLTTLHVFTAAEGGGAYGTPVIGQEWKFLRGNRQLESIFGQFLRHIQTIAERHSWQQLCPAIPGQRWKFLWHHCDGGSRFGNRLPDVGDRSH
jgi:uncharacterized repeat protein (TIGR03803 family)